MGSQQPCLSCCKQSSRNIETPKHVNLFRLLKSLAIPLVCIPWKFCLSTSWCSVWIPNHGKHISAPARKSVHVNSVYGDSLPWTVWCLYSQLRAWLLSSSNMSQCCLSEWNAVRSIINLPCKWSHKSKNCQVKDCAGHSISSLSHIPSHQFFWFSSFRIMLYTLMIASVTAILYLAFLKKATSCSNSCWVCFVLFCMSWLCTALQLARDCKKK